MLISRLDMNILQPNTVSEISTVQLEFRDMSHLTSDLNKLTFVGELLSGRSYSPKMDHVVCYLPGTLAIRFHYGMPSSHLRLAFELMDTCYKMYAQTTTRLSSEIAYFNLKRHGTSDTIIKNNDAHNLLRPETVERLWYLYLLTRNETYRDGYGGGEGRYFKPLRNTPNYKMGAILPFVYICIYLNPAYFKFLVLLFCLSIMFVCIV
ncbi:endoplasmic reticulum mannosyl-oligosaccharide 1,2-alpha-mannosidase [Trichonephila inaurata madagascariensis]|uniref:alpha-1,2-Mannosidase n=1 Tax=Trichonephila inaurata madagascariensis TaxID=2747483 RepID=A0A8X6YP91_9ARAC|nr:endoplasmic reticulum mannosyl-oligosaccharide 1,2-alpha-mannosidase [Trichonephila inaurata madagascariensis]